MSSKPVYYRSRSINVCSGGQAALFYVPRRSARYEGGMIKPSPINQSRSIESRGDWSPSSKTNGYLEVSRAQVTIGSFTVSVHGVRKHLHQYRFDGDGCHLVLLFLSGEQGLQTTSETPSTTYVLYIAVVLNDQKLCIDPSSNGSK